MWEQVYLETVGGGHSAGARVLGLMAPVDYAQDFELHSKHWKVTEGVGAGLATRRADSDCQKEPGKKGGSQREVS